MIYLQTYLHFLSLLVAVLLFAAGVPRTAAAADPIIVLEHWTNFR